RVLSTAAHERGARPEGRVMSKHLKKSFRTYRPLLERHHQDIEQRFRNLLRQFHKSGLLAGCEPFDPNWREVTPDELDGMAAVLAVNASRDRVNHSVSASYDGLEEEEQN